MAWSATLTSLTRTGSMVRAVVTFNESATSESLVETWQADDLTTARLSDLVARRLATLAARDAAYTSLASHVGQTVVPADLTQTQAQIDADAFFVLLKRLKAGREAEARGLLTAAQVTALSTLNGQVKAAFKIEYLDDRRWG